MRAHTEHAIAVIEDNEYLDDGTKKVLCSYFEFVRDRYGQLIRVLVVFCIFVVVGCAAGIWQVNELSKGRHKDSDKLTNQICQSVKQNKDILLSLVDRTSSSAIDPSTIQNPELRQAVIQGQEQAKQFKAFAHTKLATVECP